jgi:hypothetical protein
VAVGAFVVGLGWFHWSEQRQQGLDQFAHAFLPSNISARQSFQPWMY